MSNTAIELICLGVLAIFITIICTVLITQSKDVYVAQHQNPVLYIGDGPVRGGIRIQAFKINNTNIEYTTENGARGVATQPWVLFWNKP
jgi:hypothetical protein